MWVWECMFRDMLISSKYTARDIGKGVIKMIVNHPCVCNCFVKCKSFTNLTVPVRKKDFHAPRCPFSFSSWRLNASHQGFRSKFDSLPMECALRIQWKVKQGTLNLVVSGKAQPENCKGVPFSISVIYDPSPYSLVEKSIKSCVDWRMTGENNFLKPLLPSREGEGRTCNS